MPDGRDSVTKSCKLLFSSKDNPKTFFFTVSFFFCEGECLVGIEAEEDFQNCMACDKHFMGKRYIELYEASQQEWERITNRIHRTNKVPIDPNSFVILMRGLPYSAQGKMLC